MSSAFPILDNPQKTSLPEGWKLIQVGKHAKLVAGGTPSTLNSQYWENGDVLWMRSGDIHKKRVYEVDGRITELGLKNSSAALLPVNSILVALAGQGKTRGTVAINKVELSTNQSVAAIIPDKEIDYEFLFYNLDARYELLRRLSTGDGGRGGLNLQILKDIFCALPPLPEQRKIAEILSTWDEAIAKTERLLAALRARKKGLMQRLLTGQVRFAGFDDEWREQKLSDVIELKHGYQFRQYDFVDHGISIIKIGNVVGSTLDLSSLTFVDENREKEFKDFIIKNGDILMSLTGNIGRVVEVKSQNRPLLQNYRVGKFEPKAGLDKRYMKFLLSSPLLTQQLNKFANQSAQANFGKQDLDKLTMQIPQDFIEQRKIADFLDICDQEVGASAKKLEALQQQKKGLMQRLLTGQVRVRI
jgi:type I restriction enzyme S subunit